MPATKAMQEIMIKMRMQPKILWNVRPPEVMDSGQTRARNRLGDG